MKTNLDKVKEVVAAVIKEDNYGITYDRYGNIRLQSNENGLIMDITGGPGFARDFELAMKEHCALNNWLIDPNLSVKDKLKIK